MKQRDWIQEETHTHQHTCGIVCKRNSKLCNPWYFTLSHWQTQKKQLSISIDEHQKNPKVSFTQGKQALSRI